MSTLEIRDLVASVAGKHILNGITLTVRSGEVHAVMGPNGAGKSTLSAIVMGKPGYEVISGSVMLDGVDMLALPTWQRAQAGLHLVMQYPTRGARGVSSSMSCIMRSLPAAMPHGGSRRACSAPRQSGSASTRVARPCAQRRSLRR